MREHSWACPIRSVSVFVLMALVLGAFRPAPAMNLAAELARFGSHGPAPDVTAVAAVSDTIFANGFDNTGTQCLSAADCPDTGSQCSTSICNSGMCGASNTASNTTCTAGTYCNSASCVCDGTGNCTSTCSGIGSLCFPAPDQCHTSGYCTGQYCTVPQPVQNGTVCAGGLGTCQNGICLPNP